MTSKIGCPSAELRKNDYYWDIDTNEIYNPYKDPKDFSLGQLSDDWKTLLDSSASDSLIPYDLERVSTCFPHFFRVEKFSIDNQIFVIKWFNFWVSQNAFGLYLT